MQNFNIPKIMSFIDDNKLEELGKLYQIDKANHKITGSFILKSFIRSVLIGRPVSLRALEETIGHSPDLSNLLKTTDKAKAKIDHSSLGKRLEKIEIKYYQDIYEDLVLKFNNLLGKSDREKLHRFDSTIINLSGKMIKDGLRIGGKKTDSQIKITISLKNQIPHSTRFCSNQSEANEDIALVKAINESKLDNDDILLFDRGISKTSTYQDFSMREIKFITRVKSNRKYSSINASFG